MAWYARHFPFITKISGDLSGSRHHPLMQDGENPSIVNPDYGKLAKDQETKRCRAAPVDQGPPPNKDNLC